MEVAEAYSLIAMAIDSGRSANGYLITGDVVGDCRVLLKKLLLKIFPKDHAQVESESHPDIVILRPQGKSRTIKMERGKDDTGPGMKDGLLEFMEKTSYSGGWKVGIIESADRMNESAANAFLKTLEEPTARTLFLLTTDQPDSIMPTIISRTQRIDLPMPSGELSGDSRDTVLDLLRPPYPESFCERSEMGRKLAAALDEIREDSELDDASLRKSFYRTLGGLVRQWLIAGEIPRYQAYRNLDTIADAYRQSDRFHVPEEMVLCNLIDRLVFPQLSKNGGAR